MLNRAAELAGQVLVVMPYPKYVEKINESGNKCFVEELHLDRPDWSILS
jgi:hypothetical protein